MARHEVTCPICSADVPLSGDEKRGEEVFCTVCGATLELKLKDDDDGEDFDADEI